MNAQQAWQAAYGQLQMEMPKSAFDTWMRNTELVSYEDGVFIIGVRNAYARDWLHHRLSSKATRILAGVMNRTVEIRFIVWQGADETFSTSASIDDIAFDPVESEEGEQVAASLPANPSVNPRYKFDTFVVGPSNRLAHAASQAVAEKPSQSYNPLFLHGGTGLGKTHLLHAIGNQCHRSGLQVLYITTEAFTNDLISAIRSHTTPAFREKYRRIDVLLIDDIQFISGKESTQEEFFHTFNALHGQDKQIVISSDRPPKAMVTLEERLRSRFEGGLIVDILPPDYETRLAILRSKAERAGMRIPPEIIELIARRVQSNIRELEGVLTKVAAFADLSALPVTPQLVEIALADFQPHHSEVKPDEIIRRVADAYGITLERILSRDRSREVALPRQIAMYLLREEANISLPQIGETLGGRDHTTILYGCEKVADMLERDDRFRRQVFDIKEQIYGNSRAPLAGA